MHFIKVIFLCALNASLVQCGGQSKQQKNVKQTAMDSVTFTKDFEKFDLTRYEKLKALNSIPAAEKLASGAYIEMQKAASGCSYRETKPYSYFMLLKLYYPNGNIESKGAFFNVSWGGFKKGIWYQFDEKGKFIKEINYDVGYTFAFDNVFSFLQKEKIPLTMGPVLQGTGYHTSILRNSSGEGKKRWIIRWLKKNDTIEEIILDGGSGAVMERKESSYINN